MSSKQRAIDIFTRLYKKDQDMRVLLNSDVKFKPLRAFSIAKKYLDKEETAFIDRVTGKEEFSDDEWKKIWTKVVSEASAELVEGEGYEEKNTAKERLETLPRGSTTARQKQPAASVSARAPRESTWTRGKTVSLPRGSTTARQKQPAASVSATASRESTWTRGKTVSLPRGSTTARQKQPARTASTASRESTWTRGKTVSFAQGQAYQEEPKGRLENQPQTTKRRSERLKASTVAASSAQVPKGTTEEEKEGPPLDHYKNVPSGTNVRIDVRATSFCPGFHIGAPEHNKREKLYGNKDFIEFLKLWSQIKIKMSENDPLLLVDCSKLKAMDINSYIKEKADKVPYIVILFSLIDFILNCIRQSLITNTLPAELFNKLFELINYLKTLPTGKGMQDDFKKIFMKNRQEIIQRLRANATTLQVIVSSKVKTEKASAKAESGSGWKTAGKKTKKSTSPVVRERDKKVAGTRDLEWNYNNQLKAMNVKHEMGNIATSELAVKEFHMKKFIDETIKYWAEEYRASLSQYLLSRKSGSDVDFIKYKIEFMTKLIMLMLLDIKAVNPERTLQNKELYDKFSKCNLCFLLTQENADQEIMKKTMSHLERAERPETWKNRRANFEKFGGLMGRSFDWDNGMIFSPFDYYKTVIQAQESKQFEKTGNDELDKSVEALNRLLSEPKTMFYGSSYTKMFSMAMDSGIDGTRSDFNFSDVFGNALNTSAVGKRLASQVVYTSHNVKIGLSSNGNLYVIHPGEQTHRGAERAKLMVEVLGSKFGFNEVVLCLGLVDIHSGTFHNSLIKDDFNIADHIKTRTESLQTWKEAAKAGEVELTYVLIPPMPQQNPMEIFAALYSGAFREYLTKGQNLNYDFLQRYVKNSGNIIEVCTKLADRSYYVQYSLALQEACERRQIRLWRLTENGIQQLQTCRSYDLMNIHYDYHLLRNLFFDRGEILISTEETKTLEDKSLYDFVTTTLKTHPIPDKQMHEIQVLTKYKFHNEKPVKYWVLDGNAQLFKLGMFQFHKRDAMNSLKTALPIFSQPKPTLVNSTTPLEGLLKQKDGGRPWEDEGVLGYKFGESVQTAFQRKERRSWSHFNTWDALKEQLKIMLQRYRTGRGRRGNINHIEALLSTLAGLSFCTSTYKKMVVERQCTSLVVGEVGVVNDDILVVERQFNLGFLLDYYIGFLLSQPPREFQQRRLPELLVQLREGLMGLIREEVLDPDFLDCSLLAPSTGSPRQDTGGSGGTGAKTGQLRFGGGGRKKTKKRMKKKRPRKTRSKRFHKKKHKTRKKKHSKRKRKHKTKRR